MLMPRSMAKDSALIKLTRSGILFDNNPLINAKATDFDSSIKPEHSTWTLFIAPGFSCPCKFPINSEISR